MDCIVVLGGVKGSGKSTIADALEAHGFRQATFATHGFKQAAFANNIKSMAKIAFPQLTDLMLYGPSKHREDYIDIEMEGIDPATGYPMSRVAESTDVWWCSDHGVTYPRYLNARIICQTLGTWGRRLNEDAWVRSTIEHCRQQGGNWVISDQRYLNELTLTRKSGAVTVRLLRKFYEARDAHGRNSSARGTETHSSETSLLSIPDHAYDYVLDNRVELDQLPKLIDRLVTELQHPNAHWRRVQRDQATRAHSPLRIAVH